MLRSCQKMQKNLFSTLVACRKSQLVFSDEISQKMRNCTENPEPALKVTKTFILYFPKYVKSLTLIEKLSM